MIHFHFVTEVRNMKKHKICGVISSVFSVENDTGVVDAFHRLADSMQADLSQREGMPKAYYFAITEFKEVGRDDTTYRDAVQTETQQPQLYEHSDGMMREYPEANDIGQRALDDLTRAVSTGDPLDINIVAELLGIKLEVLEQVAATESKLSAKPAERGEWIEWRGGEVMPVDGTELVDVRWTNGDIDTDFAGNFRWEHYRKKFNVEGYRVVHADGPEPCARCGKRSSRPDGEHYCYVSGDAERKKHIGDTQAPILNGNVTVSSAPLTWAPSGDTGSTGSPEESANSPYAKAVDEHYGGDTAAQNYSHWVEWKGDDLPPVDIEQQVRVKFRNGEVTSPGNAGDWSWQHGENSEWDIVEYSLVYV